MGLRHRWSVESAADALLKTEQREWSPPLAGKLHLALVFPAPYALAMSNLGFLTVHRLVGRTPGYAIERFFLPLEAGKPHPPPYYSFESRRPLGDFDILALSFSYEGDFLNLPALLGPLGIPVLAADRRRGRFPLLMAGGAAIGSNHQALSRVFDVLVPGEAETTLPSILERFLAAGLDAKNVADLPGVWVPAERPEPNPPPPPFNVVENPAYSHIISPENVFHGAALFEIMRGCPRNCAFCLARNLYHPPRPVPVERFAAWLEERPELHSIGLVAPSLFDHPDLEKILELLAAKNIKLHNASVKWEPLSEHVLELLFRCGPRSLTLAPETGSPRLQRLMGKPLSEERFFATLERIWRQGFEGVKLYFMIGLPDEQESDLEETTAFIGRIHERTPAGKTLAATFSGFVPKSRTAWQDRPVLAAADFKRRFADLRATLKRLAPRVTVRCESPEEILRQAGLARAGSDLADNLHQEALTWRQGQRRFGAPVFESEV